MDVDVWSQATCSATYTGVAAIRLGISRYTIYYIYSIYTVHRISLYLLSTLYNIYTIYTGRRWCVPASWGGTAAQETAGGR